jgi:hypothetical protein
MKINTKKMFDSHQFFIILAILIAFLLLLIFTITDNNNYVIPDNQEMINLIDSLRIDIAQHTTKLKKTSDSLLLIRKEIENKIIMDQHILTLIDYKYQQSIAIIQANTDIDSLKKIALSE